MIKIDDESNLRRKRKEMGEYSMSESVTVYHCINGHTSSDKIFSVENQDGR